MKIYQPDLLDSWPGDKLRAGVPTEPLYAVLLPKLRSAAASELPWIMHSVKTCSSEDDTLLDTLYRRGHWLHGMAALLHLQKLQHILAILDFVLDLGRDLRTFQRHSMGYLVSLLSTEAQLLFDELASADGNERDISNIIEECRTYLIRPLQHSQAPKPPPSTVESPILGMGPAAPVEAALSVATAPAAPAAVDGFNDAPEELHIPSDKVGLTSDFCEESRESLAQLGRQLVELERTAEPGQIVNELFRSVHTVKGGARLLKIEKIELLAHGMESLLDQVRKGTRSVDSALIDVLLDGRRLLEAMVDEVASRGPIRTRIRPALATLAAIEAGLKPAATAPAVVPIAEASPGPASDPVIASKQVAQSRQAGSDTIRVPTEKLDDVLNTASEVFISRIRLASDVASISSAIRQFKQALHQMNEFSVEAVLRRLADGNRRLVGELQALIARRTGPVPVDRVASLVNRFHQELSSDAEQQGISSPEELNLNLLSIDEIRKRLQKNVEQLEQLSGRLQTGAMSFRMVPIAHLFDRFPTQMRELARQLGKQVHLEVSGADTELDKVMINQLADPLLHILRNSLDHGLEDPAGRVAVGKPAIGQLVLRAYYQGSNAVIEVRDDGRGIDAPRVLAKAVQNGLVEADKAPSMSRNEVFQLIFAPGLSTAETVSTVSGRGVGMDVVMTAISQIQGNIVVDSTPGTGTTIRIKLPLTLAVVGVLLVRERAHMFAFPIQHVEEILMVALSDLRHVGSNTLYGHRSKTISVMTLSNLLDFPASAFADAETPMVILAEGEKRVGILVDTVLGRQEVLIKNLGRLLKKVPFVMGCTILSDSRLVLILNAWELVNTLARKPVTLVPATEKHRDRKQHALLVVDDSVVQRNHLGSLLTQAGYLVDTAENGFEALKRLRGRSYSACCVDIVMPLMDGFEFVERLRGLPEYRNCPVFFITGRGTNTGSVESDRAAQLGVRELFIKPVDPDLLLQSLDRVCMKPVGAIVDINGAKPLMVTG